MDTFRATTLSHDLHSPGQFQGLGDFGNVTVTQQLE